MDNPLQTVASISEYDIALTPQTFRQAKIEHYLQRAEDYLQMARYRASRNTLAKVFQLDAHNSAASSLQKRIDYFLVSLKKGDFSAEELAGSNHLLKARRRRCELVLVVDQDERVLMSLTSALRRYGFGAVGAGSFDEAIEAASEYKPNLFVSEVNFENGSVGYDLYLWVKTNAGTQSLPFLFLATKIDRDALIAGKRLGVSDFILKPLDEELVLASILNCLPKEKKDNHLH